MKNLIIIILLFFSIYELKAQSCEEIMEFVKSQGYGSVFTSYNSDAISKVTFYEIRVDYKTLYFAIVCFKQKYSFDCNEYIYQVGSTTKMYYSMNYFNSAGEAFWEYIQPYSDNLGCSPSFE